MRLAYMWVQNYKDIFLDEEFKFSNQVVVSKTILENHTNVVKLSLDIKENKKYFFGSGFYGANILDAAVAVGKNGAGKTSLIRMLLETMPNIIEMNEGLKLSDVEHKYKEGDKNICNSLVQVFLSDDAEIDSGKYKIYVYSHNVHIVNKEDYPEIKFLERWQHRLQISYLSVSNVFNWTELFSKSYETYQGDWMIQKSISPASILKHSSEEYKKLFGYSIKGNVYIPPIQDFAVEKSKNALQYYLQVEQRALVEFMIQTNSEMKREMNISDTYDINFIEFDSGLPIAYFWDNVNHCWNAERVKNLSVYDKSVLEAHRIFILLKDKIQKQKNQFALHIYIQLLTEIYFTVCTRDDDLARELKNYAQDPENSIAAIDFNLLESVCNKLKDIYSVEYTSDASSWFGQIFDCVEQLKELEKKKWVLKNRKFEWQNKDDLNHKDESEFLEWFKKQFDKNPFFVRNISIRHNPLSSGETAFIHLASYILMELHKVKKESTVFLMIDEVDCYLHPEWQRKIMFLLISFLNRIEEYKFQLLITSHSPIILSDFCNEQVIRLEREEKYCKCRMQENSTFGANISLLYTDTFFLNEGLIGLFAHKKINSVIDKLNRGKVDEQMNMIIEHIGDEFARKALRRKYDNLCEPNMKSCRDIINSCTPEELERVTEYIKSIRKEDKSVDKN